MLEKIYTFSIISIMIEKPPMTEVNGVKEEKMKTTKKEILS